MPDIDDANFQYFASVRSTKTVRFHKLVFAGKTDLNELFLAVTMTQNVRNCYTNALQAK